MSIEVKLDDLSSPLVQELIAEHLSGMHGNTPAGQVHALAIDGLRAPNITFWTAWMDGRLCGCGAMKKLSDGSGEVKSMRTRKEFLRNRVAQAVLDEIVRTGGSRGLSHLYLETGSGEAFNTAHALYLRNGFVWCDAFGNYEATDFNVFMVKSLA